MNSAELPSEIEALTDTVKRFALSEVAPHVQDWEEVGEIPRPLYKRAAELGLLGLGYPEHLGGTPASHALRNALSIALARYGGAGGLNASLYSLNIGLPPILRHGSEALQQEIIPPARYLVGEEGAGFKIIMSNFNGERLGMSAIALGFAQACYDEALDWARQRKTFGAPLSERQVIRHKLVDMRMRIESTQAWVNAVSKRLDAGDSSPDWVAQVCMLKNHATQSMQFCADQAVQILGGMGFMRGAKSERIYREVKVMMIGGGAEEIMKELAARQLGI